MKERLIRLYRSREEKKSGCFNIFSVYKLHCRNEYLKSRNEYLYVLSTQAVKSCVEAIIREILLAYIVTPLGNFIVRRQICWPLKCVAYLFPSQVENQKERKRIRKRERESETGRELATDDA